jgi:AcrR family transcriptional regulator
MHVTISSTNDSTREQLLAAAEKLFLQHGLDEVSTRAIVREAGQKNQSALQYHFGGREGLISAILVRRMQQVEVRRSVLVDEALASSKNPSLRALCAVLVRGPFLLCREKKDFREFLGQLGQKLLASGREVILAFDFTKLPSLHALRTLILQHLAEVPPELLALRAENANHFVLLTISRRARLGGSFRGRRAELFFNNLVDQVAAMLVTPASPDTRALLELEESSEKARD